MSDLSEIKANRGFGAMGQIRSIDERYVHRQRPEAPEHRYTFILSYAIAEQPETQSLRILEVGCACGDLCYLIHKAFPGAHVTGMDINPALIVAARERVPHVDFLIGDIENVEGFSHHLYDIILLVTLHSHFDDCGDWFKNVCSLLSDTGIILVFGIFNESDVDVLVRARHSGASTEWMRGWSSLSKRTFLDAMAANGLSGTFHAYQPSETIVRGSDPLAKWTEVTVKGETFYMNGLGQILDFSLLIIRRDKATVR